MKRWGQTETTNRDAREELKGVGTNREGNSREHSRTRENRGDVTGGINIKKQRTVGKYLTVLPCLECECPARASQFLHLLH